MRTSRTLVSIVVLLVIGQFPAHAGSITLDAIRTGEIQQRLDAVRCCARWWTYTYALPLNGLENSVEVFPGPAGTTIIEAGFLLYDVSSIVGTVDSARLEVDLDYSAAFDPGLRVVGLGEAMTAELMAVPAGGASYSYNNFDTPPTPETLTAAEHFNAILGGPSYAQLVETGPLSGVYNIDFNSAGIDAINAAGGLFALGLDWTPGFRSIGSDFLTFNAAPRLILDVSDSEVPSPGTIALLLVALGCLYARRRVITSAGLAT